MKYPKIAQEILLYLHKSYRVRISSWLLIRFPKALEWELSLESLDLLTKIKKKISLMKGLLSINLSKTIITMIYW